MIVCSILPVHCSLAQLCSYISDRRFLITHSSESRDHYDMEIRSSVYDQFCLECGIVSSRKSKDCCVIEPIYGMKLNVILSMTLKLRNEFNCEEIIIKI